MALRSPGNGVIALALCLALNITLRAQNAPASQPSKQQVRIVGLLAQIADDARASKDVVFATKTQSQAASMLWPYDREQARAIFKRTFQSLSQNPVQSPDKPQQRESSVLSAAEKRQLLSELINQIAGRDAEMAEEMARRLAEQSLDARNFRLLSPDYCDVDVEMPLLAADSTGSISFDSSSSELLVNVALQVVERDPYRAMALGQLSISIGAVPIIYSQGQETCPLLSTRMAQLLILMRASNAGLADLLFSSAVSSVERLPSVHLSDIHTLGSYLVAATNGQARNSINSAQVARFLDLAYSRLIQQSRTSVRRNDSTTDFIYLIGKQLSELFTRYRPDRLAQLQRRVAEMSESVSAERDLATIPQPASPFDLARSARESDDESERDRLYARAAFEWLARGDMNEAASAALKIRDVSIRDRVLVRILRQQSSKVRGEDLLSLARKVEDTLMRAEALVRLARATLNSGDRLRATELLNEAESCATKAPPSIEQAQTLLSIAAEFSPLDSLRAFEVTQTTIKVINAVCDARWFAETNQVSELSASEVYDLDFDNALTALARSDFDRALLLAQQLSDKSVSLMAQIAVCRGGLTAPLADDHATDESETNLY